MKVYLECLAVNAGLWKVPAEEFDLSLKKAVSYLRKGDIKVHLSCPHSS